MSDCTAVVLTADPALRVRLDLPVVVRVGLIDSAQAHYVARLRAIDAVKTSHFFYLDDDDELPADYPSVLARCCGAGAPLAYTDEQVLVAGREPVTLKRAPYSREHHLRQPTLVHHLAVYDTAAARAARQSLPMGHYYPEFMLSWAVAGRGAEYVPEVGYRWHKKATGLHRASAIVRSLARSQAWAATAGSAMVG